MSFPTVQGSPHFNTSGTWVHVRVYVKDDLVNDYVTGIRIWGASAESTKCVDARRTSAPTLPPISVAWGVQLPWDSDAVPGYLGLWRLWDPDQPYYRICAEVTLASGTVLYKCGVWQKSWELQYDLHDLSDCATSTPVLVEDAHVEVIGSEPD